MDQHSNMDLRLSGEKYKFFKVSFVSQFPREIWKQKAPSKIEVSRRMAYRSIQKWRQQSRSVEKIKP